MKETHFKNTELGLIPVDWEVTTLGEIGSVAMCKRVFKEQTQSLGEIPFYKIGTFGGIADAYISRELLDFLKSEYRYPQKGDLLISAAGTIGRVVEYDGEDAYFQDSNIIWLEHNENNILNAYLKHLYRTIKWQTENGGIVSRLYNSDFNATTISIPPILEQEKIAEALSDVDALIQELGEVIEKKRLIKQGAMQQLLSGKTRLPGFSKPWTEYKLGEIGSFSAGEITDPKDIFDSGDYPCFGGNGLRGYTNFYNAIGENIIIGRVGALCGNIHTYLGKCQTTEHALIYRFKNGNFHWMAQLLDYLSLGQYAVGNAQPVLSQNQLSLISVLIPSVDEQQAIAQVLSDMDNEIAELESKREKYQSIKQGMMQELLTGRIRLVEPSVSDDMKTYCHEPSITRLASEE